MRLISFLILCLSQFQVFTAHVATAESQQICRMPRPLEIKCGAYIHQIVNPLLVNVELIKQQLDEKDAQIESKTTQLSELKEKYKKLYLEMKTKEKKISELEDERSKMLNEINNKNDQFIKFQMEVNEWKEDQTRKLEESQSSHKNELNDTNSQIKNLQEEITILQIENTIYKTKEDSMATVLTELSSRMETVIAEQITSKLCDDQNNQIEELRTQVNAHDIIVEKYKEQLKNQDKDMFKQSMQIESLQTELNNALAESKEFQVKEVKSCVAFDKSPGVHTLTLSTFESFEVLCNSDFEGSAWTVIQQKNSEFNFNQNWTTFKNGFGRISDEGNFFLGLEKIHKLTIHQAHELFIHMETERSNFYAGYESFAIAGEQDQYRLHLGRLSEGDDIMSAHKDMRFSTYDNDNDKSSKNCALDLRSGWWYNDCGDCNFRGIHVLLDMQIDKWGEWKPVKKMTMMIRPITS